MRTTEAHGDAEPLGRTDRDVGSECARGSGEHAGQRIGGDDRQAADIVHPPDHLGPVDHRTGRCRHREQCAEQSLADPLVEQGDVADHEVDPDRLGPRPQHRKGLRVDVGVDEEARRRGLGQAARHRHGFGRRSAFVEQGGVGHVEPGEFGDHRLEVQDRFEPSLADLRLVWRVGGVPGRILQHVAGDDRRRDGAGVPHPDQARDRHVCGGDRAQPLDRDMFGDTVGEIERRGGADGSGQRFVDQRLDRGQPDRVEHRGHVLVRRTDVASGELLGLEEIDERRRSIGRHCGVVHGNLPGRVARSSCRARCWFPRCHRYLRVLPHRRAPPPPPRTWRMGWWRCRFPACLTRTVRVPERFRGGCSFGVSRPQRAS